MRRWRRDLDDLEHVQAGRQRRVERGAQPLGVAALGHAISRYSASLAVPVGAAPA